MTMSAGCNGEIPPAIAPHQPASSLLCKPLTWLRDIFFDAISRLGECCVAYISCISVMEDFLDAPLAPIRGQGLILFPAIREEEIVFPQDARLEHLRRLGLPAEPVFQRVLQNPDEYLMPRYAPFVELPDRWEVFSGDNYLGVQQHLQEELDAPDQVEDMDNEEEDSDDEGKTMDCTKASPQDVDAMSSTSQHVTKRDDSITDDCRLLNDSGPSSSFVATMDLQDSAMPGASPAAFVSILEPVPRNQYPASVTTSEVQELNI